MTEFPNYLTDPEEPQHDDSCQWKEDGDGIWNTGCGHLFEFTADGPTENNFRFCPYCGGKISTHEENQYGFGTVSSTLRTPEKLRCPSQQKRTEKRWLPAIWNSLTPWGG